MKALAKTGAKNGADITDLPGPKLESNEILIEPAYAAICGTDHHLYAWDARAESFVKKFDLQFPLILGHEFSGTVVEVGESVTRVSIGDRITVETHIPCFNCYQCDTGNYHNCMNLGLYGLTYPGAFAELAKAPETVAFKLPDSISFMAGSLFEPAAVAMHAVSEARLSPGDSVLVCGSGPIGLVAVQAAFASGASRVIALDINPHRLKRAEKLGAVALNPREEPSLAERVAEICNPLGGADVALELTGSSQVYEFLFDLIRAEGRLVTVGHPAPVQIDVTNSINLKGLSIKGIFGRRIWESWWQLVRLLEKGRIDLEGLVTHRFSLSEYESAFGLEGDVGKVVFSSFG